MADFYSILASKGRNEDKYLRNVLGETSHVNKVEKDAIDIYGLLGELYTKKVGSGDINPNTGLREYDWKKTFLGTTPDWLSSHNKDHNEGKWVDFNNHLTKKDVDTRRAEWDIEQKEIETTERGEDYLQDEGSIGDLDIGQTGYTPDQLQDMSPKELVDVIFEQEYNNSVPPAHAANGVDETEFKAMIAGRLDKMPKMGEIDPEKKALLQQQYGGDGVSFAGSLSGRKAGQTLSKSITGIQGELEGSAVQGTNVGAGQRGEITQAGKIKTAVDTGYETYDIAKTSAELDYSKNIYNIEEDLEGDWATNWSAFLGTLPPAVVQS